MTYQLDLSNRTSSSRISSDFSTFHSWVKDDADHSFLRLLSATASPRRRLGAQDGWLAAGPGLRFAVSTSLVVKGTIVTAPAGPEDTRFGFDIEVDSNETEVDPENTGFQSMIPGTSAARTVRPGSALVRLYNRLEAPFDYCIRD